MLVDKYHFGVKKPIHKKTYEARAPEILAHCPSDLPLSGGLVGEILDLIVNMNYVVEYGEDLAFLEREAVRARAQEAVRMSDYYCAKAGMTCPSQIFRVIAR